MKYFCSICGTEATQREICSGCGSMMREVTNQHMFVLEVVDQVVSSKLKEAVVYEYRGPFMSASDASDWWLRNCEHKKYSGCEGMVALLEPPHELVVDKDSN